MVFQHASPGPATHQYSPGLLRLPAGPVHAARVGDGAVGLGEGLEQAEHRVRHHEEQRHQPGGGDDAVGVGPSLPRARLQRITDGAVPLDGDRHEAEGGDADGDPCRREYDFFKRTTRKL